jgi:hypothetical protein
MATRIPVSRRTREGLPALIEGHFPQHPVRLDEINEHGALPGQGMKGCRTGCVKRAEGLLS